MLITWVSRVLGSGQGVVRMRCARTGLPGHAFCVSGGAHTHGRGGAHVLSTFAAIIYSYFWEMPQALLRSLAMLGITCTDVVVRSSY